MGRIENGCSIYLKFGSRKVKIPVNPEELEIQYPTDHKTYTVLGQGEIVVPRKPSLRTISWGIFFPGRRRAYVNSKAKEPEDYEQYFSEALKKKTKCRLIISRSGLYDTNMRCIVSEFKTIDKGGEPGDMYYSIELTEYRDYSPETLVIASTGQGNTEAAASSESERPVETPSLRVGASCDSQWEVLV